MQRNEAKKVVQFFSEQGGPTLSTLEAMSMIKIASDEGEIYACQKENVVFIAQIIRIENKSPRVNCKIVYWNQ